MKKLIVVLSMNLKCLMKINYLLDIPNSLCEIDDELKAIYHSKDTVCIWVFNSRDERNNFVKETAGMLKAERESHYEKNYSMKVTK